MRNTIDKKRHEEVLAAARDERLRFNAALILGAKVTLTTFSGTYRVIGVTQDWWYMTTDRAGNERSWCGCNDGTWADLMKQAGVARNPRWTGPNN